MIVNHISSLCFQSFSHTIYRQVVFYFYRFCPSKKRPHRIHDQLTQNIICLIFRNFDLHETGAAPEMRRNNPNRHLPPTICAFSQTDAFISGNNFYQLTQAIHLFVSIDGVSVSLLYIRKHFWLSCHAGNTWSSIQESRFSFYLVHFHSFSFFYLRNAVACLLSMGNSYFHCQK